MWNSARFLIDYGNIEGFTPTYDDLVLGPEGTDLKEIDSWLLSRAASAVNDATDALDRWRVDELITDFESYLDDLSNWYIRRNRRRFYDFDEAAFRTLWVGVVSALRIIAPVMPFLTDHLWRTLVADPCREAPSSIHLAGWPKAPVDVDQRLLDEMAATRRVVELGRRTRMEANLKLRQPLRRVVIRGAELAASHVEEIKEELRVKDLAFDDSAEVEVTIKPDFPVAGPRLGKAMKAVAAALASGDYIENEDGSVDAAGQTLEPNELVRTEKVVLDGWVIGQDGGISVALDPVLDDELIAEGRALELIRALNEQRKQLGLELVDRIELTLPAEHADLVDSYQDWIAEEVLAVAVAVDEGVYTPVMTKVVAAD